jgi:rod shape-determining protein MreD
MQPTFSSSRILLPVRPWFIFFSLIRGSSTQFPADRPLARRAGLGRAGPLLLEHPRIPRVGMGWGFVLGLLMDVADGAVLGQHCFAYVLLAYTASSLSRRILWFPLVQQALQVMPLLIATQVLQALMRLAVGADFPGWGYFVGPFVATLLWIPATFILLLPQYRPVDQDPNRPI